MDKNTVIGFILIVAILFGFTWFQGDRAKKAQALQEQAEMESAEAAVARAAENLALRAREDSLEAEAPVEEPVAVDIYKDSLLNVAFTREAQTVRLENDKVAVDFTTKGAQPLSALVKDYYNYDSTALYLFKPGASEYSIGLFAGESIKTSNYCFDIAAVTDSSVVMRLPFSEGGYIEQTYVLEEDSYLVKNTLRFVGMDELIPRNAGYLDLDFNVTIPRMEKGYKNETQYSKINYYVDGEKKPVEIGRGRNGSKKIPSSLSWVAYQQQFFSVIFRAPEQFANGEMSVSFYPENDADRNLMACSSSLRVNFQPGAEVTVPFEFYFGPNHFHTLEQMGQKYEKIIPLGGWLVGWFTRYAIIPMFNLFHRSIASFGLIILLMTIVIKTVVFPLTYKSYASSAKMQALKPEIEKINAKYPNADNQQDQLKKQQATMDLYKRADVSVMGGCLPTLLTFPILWAMFRFFPASIELRQQSFLWCHDLSAYDSIIDFGTRIPLIGDHLSLFALLMAVTMWFYSKMTTAAQPAANDPSAASMRFMTLWMMPIMMFFICNNLSAALSYYYLLSQLIAMLQTWVIRKSIDPEKVLAKARANEGKPTKKSKWQLRLEEAQKMQQQQMRNQSGRK